MKATRISIDNAKKNKLFYFVANVVIYREQDGRCLILKRNERERVHPGKYCVPGGKLEWKDLNINNPTRMNGDVFDFEDAIEDLLKREVLEEAGIKIYDELFYINNVAYIRIDETPCIMIKFTAKYKSGKIKLEKRCFTDYAWVNANEVEDYDCIKGIKEEVKQAIILFNRFES